MCICYNFLHFSPTVPRIVHIPVVKKFIIAVRGIDGVDPVLFVIWTMMTVPRAQGRPKKRPTSQKSFRVGLKWSYCCFERGGGGD